MKNVQRSVLIWYSPEEMYRIVAEIEHYPKFLPWCEHARIVEANEIEVWVEIGIAFSGMHHNFTTRNQEIAGRKITMELVHGPFSRLDGEWTFVPLGDGTQRGCKIDLSLNYSFNNTALEQLVIPVVDKIATSMVDAFVKRAEKLYAEPTSDPASIQ